ncbi:MAG: flagellar export protein FliJ [Spirochaetota bacterium]|nr:flagellar export protein FliJ [Spirochaetota bacterium]HUH43969.1 flagellar export protein FliJ [Treponemataceae bacterium]
MKKFSFRLEKILSLRDFAEKEAKIELGRAISHAQTIQNHIEALAKEKHEQNKARSKTFAIYDLQAIEAYINRLDLKKEELFAELAKAELVVEEKRALLQEAMKERKVLTKLKEKKQDSHRKEVLLDSEKILDDIANRQI